jgi:hypothetical protein
MCVNFLWYPVNLSRLIESAQKKRIPTSQLSRGQEDKGVREVAEPCVRLRRELITCDQCTGKCMDRLDTISSLLCTKCSLIRIESLLGNSPCREGIRPVP